MKIAYCIPSLYNSGGMERVLSLKVNYLADVMHWDVSIITTGQKGLKPYYPLSSNVRLYDLGLNYDEIKFVSFFKKTELLIKKKKEHKIKLQALLETKKFDIVISMFTHETSFLYKLEDGSKKVLEIHFSKYFRNLDNKNNNVPLYRKIIANVLNRRDFRCVDKYDKFIVLSEQDRQSWGNLRNIEVIYNPLTITPTGEADTESNRVIAVGRLCKQKGFDNLLTIWSRLQENLKRYWTLTIFGGGPDYDELSMQIKALNIGDSVKIHPPVSDIMKEYMSSSIFCFTSNYEGFGLALIEGMSCGIPAISFDCPCGPSEIIHNGYDGFLVPLGDLDHFTKKLTLLMSDVDLRKQMGKAASSKIGRQFELNVIMSKWVALFENLVS